MSGLVGLLERVMAAMGPDRELDADIARVGGYGRVAQEWVRDRPEWFAWEADSRSGPWIVLPDYTASVDASLALVERVLPGWGWRGGTCCVSDDCFIFPDFNSPIHGERLKREFPQLVDGVEWSDLTDIDRRQKPSCRPSIWLRQHEPGLDLIAYAVAFKADVELVLDSVGLPFTRFYQALAAWTADFAVHG